MIPVSLLAEDGGKRDRESSVEDALDHAWAMFKLHAEQRMTVIRFYLVIVGATMAGYVTVINNGFYFVSFVVAVFGVLLSFCFYRLDARGRKLVKAAENALEKMQDELAISTGHDECRMLAAAHESSGGLFGSFTKVFRLMFLCTGFIFLALSTYGLMYSGGLRRLIAALVHLVP